MKIPQIEKTSELSHRAVRRGYAAGMMIEPGDHVPADIPISQIWMVPADEYRAPDPGGVTTNDPGF